MTSTTTVEAVDLNAHEEAQLRAAEAPPSKRAWPRTDLLSRQAQKQLRLRLAIESRPTPFVRVALAWAPLRVTALLLAPRVRPLRGKAIRDWRLELVVAHCEIATLPVRRWMNLRLGQALAGLYRHSPIERKAPGWYWHAGCWTSAELAEGIRLRGTGQFEPLRITPTETRRWSIWLEAQAEGIALPAGWGQ